jgi:hypothetical protein
MLCRLMTACRIRCSVMFCVCSYFWSPITLGGRNLQQGDKSKVCSKEAAGRWPAQNVRGYHGPHPHFAPCARDNCIRVVLSTKLSSRYGTLYKTTAGFRTAVYTTP